MPPTRETTLTDKTPGTATVAELLGPLYTPAFREAFPDVSAPYSPFGYNVLIQLRQPVMKTRGGIIKPGEVEDTERYRTQAALVRALGVAAYTHRDTGKSWVEGAWCKPGDFVRAPMFGGDRVDITHKVGDDKVKTTFVFIKDSDLIALVTGDPLNIENS